jgi:hypothetical protein
MVNELRREAMKISLKPSQKTSFGELRQGQPSWLAKR